MVFEPVWTNFVAFCFQKSNSLRLKIYVDFDIYGQISIMQMFPSFFFPFLEKSTDWLPHFGLTYIIYIPVMFGLVIASSEIYIFFFFSDSDALWLGAICQIWRPKVHHQILILFSQMPVHCGMRDKGSMFLSAVFKNLIFLCSF